jgi:FkbM family methyltransferase
MQRKIKQLYWKLPVPILFSLIKFRSKTKPKYKAKVSRINGLISLVENPTGNKNYGSSSCIWFYHPQRISRYFIGINERLEKLLSEYCIDQIPDLEKGIVIDIGSNVGEFSLALSKRRDGLFFIRFEPSITENMASLMNTVQVQSMLIAKALWSTEKELPFYQANESGDSSIFQAKADSESIKIYTTTLDKQMEMLSLNRIELIKLEAEGAEPEILQGSTETLKKTRYLTADLGPERGIGQETTFLAANKILADCGFILIGRNHGGRQCYLFKNSKLQ